MEKDDTTESPQWGMGLMEFLENRFCLGKIGAFFESRAT